MNRRLFLKRMAATCVGGLIIGYPFVIERYLLTVNLYQIPVPNLPKAFTNFRIAQLTDIHYGFFLPQRFIQRVIHQTNALGADIIVCTGDYISGHEPVKQTYEMDWIWRMLMKLHARDGVYMVLGNHDHWTGEAQSLAWLARSGRGLRHRSITIERSGQSIWLGGAGDFLEDSDGIDHAFSNVPEDQCRILLAHNPDTIDLSFKTRVDLVISGHTHGGQVVVPFWGPPIIPVMNKRYTYGLIHTDKCPLFISRGVGTALMPVRCNCPPEIAVLNLIPASSRS